MNPKILPTILILIDFCSAVPYALAGDWRRCIYWIAAGILTLTVTY